ncbi:HVO_0476 family zinc finger protein [Methanobrevibacter sp. DSM 116169]|uniref:HVO_0476 family zinc finger protein n=1 Tax=Methanobrevibacter sp. DSM 116169 TaxID=3242727 RepID=UPI0038FC2759
MECPICGSEDISVLKVKTIPSKKKEIKEYLLKCNPCQHVFKDTISQKNPVDKRLIISEQDNSIKTIISLFPNEELNIGDNLISELGQVEVTSMEVDGKRVNKSIIEDIDTIWASSVEIPIRIGVSVDLQGKVASYKIDIDRDIEISVGDIVKIEDYIIKIHVIKTTERRKNSGYALSKDIKRIYGRPINLNNYDFDFTKNIVKKTNKLPKYLRK